MTGLTSTAWSNPSSWFGVSSMDKRPAGVTGLYNAEFMDHVQYPDYKYRMENATHTHEGVNPSCGDELTFYLRMADDGTMPFGGETEDEMMAINFTELLGAMAQGGMAPSAGNRVMSICPARWPPVPRYAAPPEPIS